jgi:amino acid transporter
MTGTEAISNGVGAFKNPSSKNAAITLSWMAAILAVFFLGTSVLARHYAVMPSATETVLSQLGRRVLGGGSLYFALQYATFAVLVLAANTAFADFPRLASILARDGYMPRQFAARGDRLAFSNGIIALALIAALLIWMFRGETSALIPLYAIGVFVCFTLSQAGMVMHWFEARQRDGSAALRSTGSARSRRRLFLSCKSTKFTHGAWIVVLIIPVIIAVLRRIHRHYEFFAREVAYTGQSPLMFLHHTVIVPVNGITKPGCGRLSMQRQSARMCARYTSKSIRIRPRTSAAMDRLGRGVELTIIPSRIARSCVRSWTA